MGRAESDFFSVLPWSLFYFRAYYKAVAIFFYLNPKIISALFSNLETINKQQSQLSVLERKSGPSVTGSSKTLGIPNRRQPNFMSELIFMLFCIFAFLWSNLNIEYVANIILLLEQNGYLKK